MSVGQVIQIDTVAEDAEEEVNIVQSTAEPTEEPTSSETTV